MRQLVVITKEGFIKQFKHLKAMSSHQTMMVIKVMRASKTLISNQKDKK